MLRLALIISIFAALAATGAWLLLQDPRASRQLEEREDRAQLVTSERSEPGSVASSLPSPASRVEHSHGKTSRGLLLRGRVRSNEGAPIRGALLTASKEGAQEPTRSPNRRARTSGDGTFELLVDSDGPWTLRTTHPNWVTSVRAQIWAATNPDPLLVELAPGLTLRGSVESVGGSPIPAARVSLEAVDPGRFDPVRTATTGSQGHFQLHGLTSGQALLRIEADGYAALREPISISSQGSHDEHWVLENEVLLSGRLRDADGQPVAGAFIQPLPSPLGPTRSLENGSFNLHGLADDPVDLLVTAAGFPAHRFAAIDAHESPVDLVLEPGVTLRGRVTEQSSGAPVYPATLTLRELAAPGRGSACIVRTEKSGAFEFSATRRSLYELEISATGFISKRLSSFELDRDEALEIELSRGASIVGRVWTSDGQPASGSSVWLFDAHDSRAQTPLSLDDVRAALHSTRVGRRGDLEIPGLADGEYGVVIHHPEHLPQRQLVRIDQGGADRELDCHLRLGASLFGHVFRDGILLTGGSVEVRDERSRLLRRLGIESNGTYRVEGLEAGSYELRARLDDWASDTRSVILRTQQATQLDLGQ